MPPYDPLVNLWQTAPKPDTQHLVQDLQRQKRLHRRTNRSVLAICCAVALLLVFEEATGRLATRGALSVVWILGIVLAVVRCRRARWNRSDAVTLDTVSLLKFMIAQAKSDLSIARRLYAGVPCGAAAGALMMKLARIGAPPSAVAVRGPLHGIQTGAGVALLLAMIVTGVILARARSRQVQQLSEKLRLIEEDL